MNFENKKYKEFIFDFDSSFRYDLGGERFDCAYYGYNRPELCVRAGDEYDNFGLSAREACCVCNGGDLCGERTCVVNIMFTVCGDVTGGKQLISQW